ncbi:cytochrome P450, partial [Immersiella caudata]
MATTLLVVGTALVVLVAFWSAVRRLCCTKSSDNVPGTGMFELGATTLLGGVLRARLDSVQYVHGLLHSSNLPILWTRILGRRVLLVKPELDYDLARHSRDLSLASFASFTLCRPIFGLSDDGVALLRQTDTRPTWAAELLDADRAKAALDSALRQIEQLLEDGSLGPLTNFNAWVFHMSAGATAHSLWGVDNPWLKSTRLMDDFYEFQQVFESLYLPLAPLTAPRANNLRRSLLSKLRTFHIAHPTVLPDNIAHRLNIITSLSPDKQRQAWYANPDYSIIELVTSLAILPTVGNITIWLLRHLFARPDILSKVQSEITKLTSSPSTKDALPTIDLSQIRNACPNLMAAWYETLRLHMTGVAREATASFPLSSVDGEVQKGDILFLPMAESNRDPKIWDHPREWFPERFIDPGTGKLTYALTRKVKGFGVAGNLCPGRYHSFGVIMGVVVGMVVAMEVEPLGGSGWEGPVVAGGVSAGG